MRSIPIILDTDIGDDIDDALALALILNSPELELRGITTVFRHAQHRALLARKILRAWNRLDIPVAAGASKTLLGKIEEMGGSSQFDVLDEKDLSNDDATFPHALDWMLQNIDTDSEDRITLVTIGALTNIALLFARAPELARRCRIVMMGGQWSVPEAEWNIRCDPEAAAAVFSSGAEISMVGYEITTRCQLSDEQMDILAQGSTAARSSTLINKLLNLWRKETGARVTLHDPLAVMSLFDDCVQFEPKRIEIGLCGEERACTIAVEGKSNVRVAVDVDVERAISLFMERLAR